METNECAGRLDVALAGLICAVTLMTVEVTGDGDGLTAGATALLMGETLPLAWRRTRTGWVWAIVGVATAAYGLGEYPDTVLDLGPALSLFTVAARCPLCPPRRRAGRRLRPRHQRGRHRGAPVERRALRHDNARRVL